VVNWRRKFGFPNDGMERQRGSFAMSIMSLTFRIGGLTIQRIAALDAPFLPAIASARCRSLAASDPVSTAPLCTVHAAISP
jgi:hypothetical protein